MKPKELYRAICKGEEGLPVFLQCWWLDAVAEAWNVALAIKGEQITGVWPYALQQRFTITLMRNPSLTPYLGPHVFFPQDMSPRNRDSFEHEVVAKLLEQLPHADIWVQSLQPGMKQVGLFQNLGITTNAQQTFLIPLEGRSQEEVFRQFKEPVRRNILQAQASIRITEEPDMTPTLHEFQGVTLLRKRVAQNTQLEDMDRLMQACIREGKGMLYAARQNGVVQALVWNVWDRDTSYYLAGAKNPRSDDHGAISTLLWHTIRLAMQRGNTTFDMLGNPDPGVERFFRGFSGRRELYLRLRRNDSWLWRLRRLLRWDA